LDEIKSEKREFTNELGRDTKSLSEWPKKSEDIETRGFVIRAKRSVKDL